MSNPSSHALATRLSVERAVPPRIGRRGLSRSLVTVTLAAVSVLAAGASHALDLDGEASRVTLMSTKVLAGGDQSAAERFVFEGLSGSIDSAGTAEVSIPLASVQTGVDIRNERMAKLLFESTEYPDAVITAAVPADATAPGTHVMELPITVALHGGSAEYTVPVLVSSDDAQVVVTATEPVLVDAASFDLGGGLGKLTELAGLLYIPTTVPVSFTLAFDR